jgi:hypothetical protein
MMMYKNMAAKIGIWKKTGWRGKFGKLIGKADEKYLRCIFIYVVMV